MENIQEKDGKCDKIRKLIFCMGFRLHTIGNSFLMDKMENSKWKILKIQEKAGIGFDFFSAWKNLCNAWTNMKIRKFLVKKIKNYYPIHFVLRYKVRRENTSFKIIKMC